MLTRPIDNLGRIVIPKEIRKFLNLQYKDRMIISAQGNKLILSKLENVCGLCDEGNDLIILPNGGLICATCMKAVFKIVQPREYSHL
jgi:transcriptional pleiotropic regulator of transition state genes